MPPVAGGSEAAAAEDASHLLPDSQTARVPEICRRRWFQALLSSGFIAGAVGAACLVALVRAGPVRSGFDSIKVSNGLMVKTAVKKDGPPYTEITSGTCGDAGYAPIHSEVACLQAGKELNVGAGTVHKTMEAGRPEGCYHAVGNGLWVGINPDNVGIGAIAAGAQGSARQPLCARADLTDQAPLGPGTTEEARAVANAKNYREEETLLRTALDDMLGWGRFSSEPAKEMSPEEKQALAAKLKRLEESAKEARERLIEKEKRRQAALVWEKKKHEYMRRIDALKALEPDLPVISLYCFSLMMPFGYEPALLAEQMRQGVGIYNCEEHVVYSNATRMITTGAEFPIPVELLRGSLAVAYGGRWGTALNTGVFNRLWTQVITSGRYRFHDWVVKVDPDAVFFPTRLRQLLRRHTPFNEVRIRAPEPQLLKCGTCALEGHAGETCTAHVRQYQAQNRSCAEALKLVARTPPEDCGCVCDDFACEVPPQSAMYLNNCRFGLHGPIEVLSRRAVATYVAGLPKCVSMLSEQWGEDIFLDQCMSQKLGVTRVNEYSLLNELACNEQPGLCGSSDIAFHPFKTIPSYFSCWNYANSFGHGPAYPWNFLIALNKSEREPLEEYRDRVFAGSPSSLRGGVPRTSAGGLSD